MSRTGEEPLKTDARPDFQTLYLEGIEHFNRAEFWESHESWEQLWLVAESELAQFLQGLIQIAAAYHHIKRGTFPGSVRLFDAALLKLQPYRDDFCGIARSALIAQCAEHRVWVASLLGSSKVDPSILRTRLGAEQFPKIELVAGWEHHLPTGEVW